MIEFGLGFFFYSRRKIFVSFLQILQFWCLVDWSDLISGNSFHCVECLREWIPILVDFFHWKIYPRQSNRLRSMYKLIKISSLFFVSAHYLYCRCLVILQSNVLQWFHYSFIETSKWFYLYVKATRTMYWDKPIHLT